MKKTDVWWTCPTEGETGKTIMVTGRDLMDEFRLNGKYIYRIEVKWEYKGDVSGMPDKEDSILMEEATEALKKAFKNDTVGVMTGIYTGEGLREWIFYTKNLHIFSKVFNKALEELPSLPLIIEASEDACWEEYLNMKELTYLPDED